jgi:N6-adenosine-specific RNA methylase IME4
MTIIAAGALLVDPPWPFDVRSSKGEGRSAGRHYRGGCMSIKEIAAYPVAQLAAADSFLFLWVTGPRLPDAFAVMAAWGFIYSGTAFCWVKPTKSGTIIQDGRPYYGGWAMGGGYGTRKNAEQCLLGRRGRPKRLDRGVHELIVAYRREHSRKPDEQYERIERFCDGPFLELFARQRRSGWISIGDELDKFSQFPAVATSAANETDAVPGTGLSSSVAG